MKWIGRIIVFLAFGLAGSLWLANSATTGHSLPKMPYARPIWEFLTDWLAKMENLPDGSDVPLHHVIGVGIVVFGLPLTIAYELITFVSRKKKAEADE